MIKDFFERNRQKILYAFVITAGIFFLFYWTDLAITAKVSSINSSSKQAYTNLEKTVNLVAKQNDKSVVANNMQTGLLSFIQQVSGELNIAAKLATLRPVAASGNIEHISLRFEALYYDEFINFIKKLESYDNLWIKNLTFTRRYDNPKKIDLTLEVIKQG